MARITTRRVPGVEHVRDVKNLGWFFRKARQTAIVRFDLWQANDGWEMFVDFDDNTTFHTPYASLAVFKDVMDRQRSLRGVRATVHREDGSVQEITFGGGSVANKVVYTCPNCDRKFRNAGAFSKHEKAHMMKGA